MAIEQRAPADAKLAFFAALGLACIAAIIDNGILGWLVAPIVLALSWFAIFRAPLRDTMLVLMFLGLVLENPSEVVAAGQWQSPIYPLGCLMLAHFKMTIGGWMFFGGMDLLLLGATVTYFLRGRQATVGIPTPRLMIRLAQLTFATILFTFLIGK